MLENISSVIGVVGKAVIVVVSIYASTLLIPWLKNTAIPWLKEKHLYSIVRSFVLAAEKMAESGQIDKAAKRDYVVGLLAKKGIEVTDDVLALIEMAVMELDLIMDDIYGSFTEE